MDNSVEEMEENAKELITKILGQRLASCVIISRFRRHFSFVSISFPVVILPLCRRIYVSHTHHEPPVQPWNGR